MKKNVLNILILSMIMIISFSANCLAVQVENERTVPC